MSSLKQYSGKMEIKDVVHGNLYLPNDIAQIVQTPHFIRLKSIKQLGFLYLTEPSAISTRYEHCIGTYWLARKMLEALVRNSSWLRFDKNFSFYRQAVEIAALLHDIGHGPFSHPWETIVDGYDHEKNAREIVISIFDYLTEKNIQENTLGQFRDNNRFGEELIIALIMGDKSLFPFDLPSRYNFIFEIVHNKKCKVDVDKWDYLLRDRYYLKNYCNPDINFENVYLEARASESGSCIEYRYEDYEKIYEIFYVRWTFHKTIYRLPLQLAAEKLMKSIIKRGDNLEISNVSIYELDSSFIPAYFDLIDDNVLKMIENDPDSKFFENTNIIERVNKDDINEDVDRIIRVEDKLIGPGFEMPLDSCFAFYGDEKKKTKILRDYSIIQKFYYFRFTTRE